MAAGVVGAGLASWCTIQVAYAIGVSKPLSFYVDLGEANGIDAAQLEAIGDLVSLPQLGREGLRETGPKEKEKRIRGALGLQGGGGWQPRTPGNP